MAVVWLLELLAVLEAAIGRPRSVGHSDRMPTARYEFVRANVHKAGLAPYRIGSAALFAILEWTRRTVGRGYVVEAEEAEKLVATLRWNAGDHSATEDLVKYCTESGVERVYLGV